MGTLYELAREYRENQRQIERRIAELEDKLTHTSSQTEAHRLRHRINVLHKMLADCRASVYEMEHYYDKR